MKTVSLLGAALACVFSGLALHNASAAEEPQYQGKSFSYWLEAWNTNIDAARPAFIAMGTNAVPCLIKILEHKPSKLAEFFDKQIADFDLRYPGGIPLRVRNAFPSTYGVQGRRETAAFLLSQLGPGAEAAIPLLFRLYTDTNEDERVHGEVYDALGNMGEKGVVLFPHYLAWLTNADPDIQTTGAHFLGSIGPKARLAVPELVKSADSTNQHVATAAAIALWSIDRQTNTVLRVHIRHLQQTNHSDRDFAIYCLRNMGPGAAETAPLLEPFLRDPESSVRESAEKALCAIDPHFLAASLQRLNASSTTNLARLIELLQERTFSERYAALEALAVYGPSAKSAVPALIEALDGFSPGGSDVFSTTSRMNSQRQVAEALAEIGPEAEEAVPALVAHVKMGYYFQYSSCKALGRIGPCAREAVPILELALADSDPNARLAAADALTRIFPNHCSNAVAVLRALQHDPQLAQVWRSDGHGAAYLTDLLDFDNATSRQYRLSAAVPLWRLHLEAESPVPGLVEELRKSENAYWCIELLGDLGPDARAALPVLAPLAGPEKGIPLRRAAAIAIRKIAPEEADRLNLPGILALP
jgi:HEAT repeat protein